MSGLIWDEVVEDIPDDASFEVGFAVKTWCDANGGIRGLTPPLAKDAWFSFLSPDGEHYRLVTHPEVQAYAMFLKALGNHGFFEAEDCVELYASMSRLPSSQVGLGAMAVLYRIIKHFRSRLVTSGELPLLTNEDPYSIVSALTRSEPAVRAAVTAGTTVEEAGAQVLAASRVLPVLNAYMQVLNDQAPDEVRVSGIIHTESGCLCLTKFGLSTFATRDAATTYHEAMGLGDRYRVVPLIVRKDRGCFVDMERWNSQLQSDSLDDVEF